MKKIIQSVLAVSLLLVSFTQVAAPEAFIEGVHYTKTAKRMATKDDNVVEVMELFSYSCPHCFRLSPKVMKWQETLAEDVQFTHVPAIFRDSWLQLAKVFYAAKATGNLAKLHPLLFNAIHIEKRQLTTEKALLDFVAEQGIDRDMFKKTIDSFAVKSKVKQAMAMSQSSGITGVPSMIINGKYRTDATMAGGMDEMLNVVDFLIQKEKDR